MGKVNMSHLLDGQHRAIVAATTAAHHHNKCNDSSNPVQLPCRAEVDKQTTQMIEIEAGSSRDLRLQPPHTRGVTNIIMMIMLELVE